MSALLGDSAAGAPTVAAVRVLLANEPWAADARAARSRQFLRTLPGSLAHPHHF